MGFIGYLAERAKEGSQSGDVGNVVRIFLECREESREAPGSANHSAEATGVVSYTYAVAVVFPRGKPCRLKGVNEVLALKKFYKLVHSLEERAREHGNPRERALGSKSGLLEHLGYTRNARDLSGVRVVSRLDDDNRRVATNRGTE